MNNDLIFQQEEFIKIMMDLKLAYPKKIDDALPANQACGNLEGE